MKFQKVYASNIVRCSRKKGAPNVKLELLRFLDSDMTIAKVTDTYYHNNNDLRRAIQSAIVGSELPIRVFMCNGNTYVEKM